MATAGSALAQRASAPSARPNLVVITLDTVRADALGAYGQALPTSPRIDGLAADGVLFEQVVSSSPSTLPSHSTLFTGKEPFAHGVRANTGYQLSDQNLTLAEVLKASGYRTAAEIAAPVLAARGRLDQGFDSYRSPGSDESLLEYIDAQQSGRNYQTRNAEAITAAGIAFVRSHARQPFFLWLHYFDAHREYDPPAAFERRIPRSPYHAEVARIDHGVGQLIDEITKLGLRERTWVVVTADHGEGLGEHGEDSHSFFVYDSTMRVPLILWGPASLPRGVRVSSLVRLIDVAPTVLDLMGLPALEGAQGTSLRPVIESPGADPGLVGYGESLRPTSTFGSSVLRFVRHGRWKYIHKLNPELYDVIADPAELANRAASQPKVVEELRGRLETLVRTGPSGPGDAAVTVDAATAAQLQALGYAGADAPAIVDEASLLELRGPDPAARIGDVSKLSIAFGYLRADQTQQAEALFREVVSRNPQSAFALDGLIKAVLRQDRPEESIELLRRGLELDPASTKYRMSLQKYLRERGDLEGSEALLRETLALEPCAVIARLHLADLLHERKDYAGQRKALEAEPAKCGGPVQTRNALAYALATAPVDALRDGPRALSMAQAAVTETDAGHPGYLDTLACAYAELGRYPEATAQLERAIALIEGHQVPEELRVEFREHLAAFAAGRPVRAP